MYIYVNRYVFIYLYMCIYVYIKCKDLNIGKDIDIYAVEINEKE